ncbi:MAG: L,D-transpeptidase family protein [Bacteroidales bacterium]|nr:L,D-transpeptidase family protein [Bacteroidales bacterium]
MRFVKVCFVQLTFIFATCSCSGSTAKFDNVIPNYNRIDEQRLDSAIKQILEMLPDSLSPELKWVKLQYSSRDFEPEWVYPSSNYEKIDTLISFLSKTNEHGIMPEQFDLDNLILLNQKLKQNNLSYVKLALMEIKASNAYLRYCKALNFGLFLPKEISPNYYFETLTIDSTFVRKCFNEKKTYFNRYLKQIQPALPDYLQLQSERKKYACLADSAFVPIPALPGKETIKKGSVHPIIPLISSRLMITGELPYNQKYLSHNQIFDSNLLKAINTFRTKTGQYIDEEIGNNTIRALNYTFTDYVNKIDANLERLRWKPAKPLGNKYIRVNVADMTLKAFRHDTLALRMKVCVGKSPKNKTPFLRSNIYEVVLNPTWSIPNNIVIKETSKLAEKDTAYLRRNKIRVFRNGIEIQPRDINWSKISENYQPYTLVQDSGNINALGRIKFNFSNKFSVYLHDTNSKSAFNRHNRAISHGCVRVEKPLELSYFCLPEYDRKNKSKTENRELLQDKIHHSIHLKVKSKKGKETLETLPETMKLKRIGLFPSVPILIDYSTCFTDKNGKMTFRDDLYEMDKYIINNLKNTKIIAILELSD